MPLKSFGELVREKRKARNWRQEDLAARAGLSTQLISAIEKGTRTNPTRSTICTIAITLDFTLEEAGMILCPQLARAA